jgi:peptidoglycan/xylan/chitin deacetylase (PgdA/CDA1 family)
VNLRRARLIQRVELFALAVAGIVLVSVPVAIALLLSGPRTSSVVTTPQLRHATPERAIARMRCTPERGYYALTFEDGPFAGTTARLVAALEDARAVGTFFDVGHRAGVRVDLVELQRGVGQVASHGYSHTDLTTLSSERRIGELRAAARGLDYPNALVRPPYAASSDAVDADLRRTGLTPVYWTVDSGDVYLPVDAIVRRALSVEPGGIVRLHEGTEATIEAVPKIVAALRERGMCPGFVAADGTTAVKP